MEVEVVFMVENRYQIKANIKSKMYNGVIPSVTANDHIIFEVTLFDDALPMTLNSAYRYTLVTMRKNNTSVIREGTLSGSVILFELGASETTTIGRVEASIQIYDADNKRISSAPIAYDVLKDFSLSGSLPADDKTLVIANEFQLISAIDKSELAMARVDTLIQETSQPEEVVDIRVRNDGTVATTAGQYVRELDAQLAEIAINLKTKGAILDGVIDCTQYLINAHDALPSQGGKILIPPGRMKVTSAVTFTKTVILEGTSVAHLVGTTGSVIVMDGSGELIFTGSSSGVRDLMIDGIVGNTGNGITMLNARPWLDNVTVVNQGAHGVQVGHATDTAVNVNSGYFANLRVKENVGDGLRIVHADSVSPNANAIVVNKIDCGYNDGNGITLINCFDNQFIGVHAEGNKGYGIQLTNADSNVFLKPYCEFNTLGELKADTNSEFNYVYGHRRDANIFGFVFDNVNNFIQGRSTGKGIFPLSNKQIATTLGVSNEAISGVWEFEQDGSSRDLIFTLKGTSSNSNVKFKHGGTGVVTHSVDRMQIGGGSIVSKNLHAGATLSFGTIPANSTIEKTITVTGASLYDPVYVVPNASPEAGLIWSAYVSAADTVTVRLANITTAAITPVNIGWKAFVTKHA